MLRRIGIIAVLSLMVAALAAVPALAQTAHFENLFIGGTGTDRVAATGSLVELTSPAPVEFVLTAQGTATLTCQSANGKTRVITGVPVTSQSPPGSAIYFPTPTGTSGTLFEVSFFSVETGAPVATGGKKCPKSWSSSLSNVVYDPTKITLSAYQNNTLVAQTTAVP